MPRAQDEVVAKGLTSMFIHNFDALVTKDYLDTRFSEFEVRVTAEMDRRFHQVDQRFSDLESRMELRFAEMDVRFARVNVLLGVILVAVAVPVLQTVLIWVG